MTAGGAPHPLAVVGPARLHTGVAWVTVVCCVAACVPAGLRWLRVAQREHYLAGSVLRFAGRWWGSSALAVAAGAVALVAAVLSVGWPLVGLGTAAVVALGPPGLPLRGRTAALAWTRRLRTLAAVTGALVALLVVIGVLTGLAAPLAVLAVLGVPAIVDLASAATAPVERRLADRFVEQASSRLQRVHPRVVGVTGSFGKTSTKGHIAHLVRPDRSVVATPASFNNRAGLARAVNEHLADGTEVFVAEMGTYGPGEIAELCRWCPPDIAVITAIGPVHLERFGSEATIVAAKAEILAPAPEVVLPIDDPRLAALADRAAHEGKRVVRCSAVDVTADVCVVRHPGEPGLSLLVSGRTLAEGVEVPSGVQPLNLACAVGVALLLGSEPTAVAGRLHDLPPVEHRLQAGRAASGATVLDDTYNANPAGAAEALATLARSGRNGTAPDRPGAAEGGRRVVITPGMVELGPRQHEENRRFGAACAGVATDLLVVGRTNRRALLAGAASVGHTGVTVRTVTHRDEAVAWVRGHLGPGDAVLYENDLPDHYP